MKKLIAIILLCFFSNIFSQNRFIYQYKFVPDVTKKDSIISDFMVLDYDSKTQQSNFYSNSKKISDSLIKIIKQGNPDKIKLPKYNPNLIYNITKDLQNNKITFHVVYSGIKMKIPEDENPVWAIKNEKRIISNFSCQKATTKYKGREWVAWFTADISINDGPYKFHGLPGLIIKIGDTRNEHVFTLIKTEIDNSIKISDTANNEKIITQKQLNRALDEGAANVNQNIKDMYVSDKGYSFILNDGNVLQIDKNVTNVERELSKQSKRMSNPIEIKNK